MTNGTVPQLDFSVVLKQPDNDGKIKASLERLAADISLEHKYDNTILYGHTTEQTFRRIFGGDPVLKRMDFKNAPHLNVDYWGQDGTCTIPKGYEKDIDDIYVGDTGTFF